jgi:phage terminase large subunit GpA-like protein
MSPIEDAFLKGTQERWNSQCPNCGDWHSIDFDEVKFEFESTLVNRKKQYRLTGEVRWVCPSCGFSHTESEMREAPQKWIAENNEAVTRGIRSFWLSAFSSPWVSWEEIVLEFLQARENPEELKVVFNTLLGRTWEERSDVSSPEELMTRREDYGTTDTGASVEVPGDVYVLTCGVDVQDDRLEYEVVGHGFYDETWGIRKGILMGAPDTDEVWQRLDDVLDRGYPRADGISLSIAVTFVDSGGHYTQDVYKRCRERQTKKVFAIKGKGGEGIPYVNRPTKVAIKDRAKQTCWLYTLGVDSGKAQLMSWLRVESPGPKYCHFPLRHDAGYDETFFEGLLSERLVRNQRTGKWGWERIPGHTRQNESLDCRNYACAAFRLYGPDMDAVKARVLKARIPAQEQRAVIVPKRPLRKRSRLVDGGDDW